MSCGVGCRHGLDLVMLWPWRRSVATALIRPLPWKPPYAASAALKRPKKKKKKIGCLWEIQAGRQRSTAPRIRWDTFFIIQARGKGKRQPSFFFFFFFFLFRTAPAAYINYQARGRTRAVAAGVRHSHSNTWDLHHSSRQRWILNPLSKARDWTCILLDTSWVCYHWVTTGTLRPPSSFSLVDFRLHH